MEIKKCTITDISAIGAFYDRIVEHMVETGTNYPKWMYKIYPSEQSVRATVQKGTQNFCTLNGRICAAFVLNEDPGGAYEKGDWKQSLQIGEYLVIHTLAVAPEFSHQGIATQIIQYCMDYARSNGYKALRIDVVPTNFPAIRLYKKLGFTDAGEKDLERNIPGIPTFTLLEYLIDTGGEHDISE